MNKILQTIVDRKREEVRALKDMKSSLVGAKRSDPRRPFAAALDKRPELAIIAEVKKASPSKGVIKADFDPLKISTIYEKSGASAISVLTDENFFQGHIDYLKSVRANVSLPVLRKDFIIDILQVQQTAQINADAVLLIAACLDGSLMKDLYQAAAELDIEVLIEIHNTKELDMVMKLDPSVIGINNRNLDTFVTDISVTIDLIKHIPQEIIVVSESGISNGNDASKLKDAGARALLVGESLMRADDTGSLIKEISLFGR
jgi:indole-3-glycerol phosphate synthase